MFKDFEEANASAPEGQKFQDFYYGWKNGGVMPNGEVLKFSDALTMNTAPFFLPQAINYRVQEAVEPLLVGTSLLEKIPFVAGTQVDFGVAGAVDGDFDVGEEEDYPEMRFAMGGGSQIAKTGKQGVICRFTEELIRYSQYNLVDQAVRLAGRAMARAKEEKIFNMILRSGITTHDNVDFNASQYGTTTGRGLTGAKNGSVTFDDLMEMYMAVQANGFVPDILMVHPLTFLMFLQDSQLRHFAVANQSAWFGNNWNGNLANNTWESARGGEGLTGAEHRVLPTPSAVNPTDPSGYNPNLNTAPSIPGYYGLPLRVITSPFIPFNAASKTTSIYMAKSSELGFYVEEHGIQTDKFTDPLKDILRIRLKERYSIRPKNQGLGIAVAKNISVKANMVNLPAQVTLDINGSVDEINRFA